MAVHYPRLPVKGPVVIQNCVQVAFLWQIGSVSFQHVSNVFHATYTGTALAGTEPQTIAASLTASTGFTGWLAHIHPSFMFRGVHVKDLRQANLPTYEFLQTTPIAGTSPGTELAASSALVVSLRTAKSGKGFFGRCYLAGITQDNLADARHFSTTIQTPALNMAAAYQAAMQAANFPWGIGQRSLAANTDPNAPPSQQQARQSGVIPITSTKITDLRIDSQRRRLGKANS